MIYTLYRVWSLVKLYFFRRPWDVHEIMTFVGPQPIGQRVTSAQCRVKLLAHRAGLPGNVDYDYTVGFPPRPCSRKAGHPADLPVKTVKPPLECALLLTTPNTLWNQTAQKAKAHPLARNRPSFYRLHRSIS